jgi:nucleotide-binding universal stress UspA family protein
MQFILNKIMVPIDFSGPSDWGFNYAYNLAQQFGSDLYVVHIYKPPYLESSMPPNLVSQIIGEKESDLMKHLKSSAQAPLVSKNKKSDPVKIHYILESGANSDLVDVSKKNDIDLIVMGTHGANKAIDKVWGTNTAKVINEANCPVLAIPIGSEFNNVENIAYATDYDSNDIDNIMQLVLFATAINANVHCIHVNNILDINDEEKEIAFKEKFEARFKDMPVTFSVKSSTSIEEGLETFLRVNHINILSMLTHKRNLWERLFGEKSVTKEMAFRSKTPILAFHS